MAANEIYLNDSLKKIAKGAGVSVIGAFFGMGLGYFSRMVIARWLGASDYGLISLALAIFTITISMGLIGLPTGIIRYVSFYKGKEDDGRIKGTIISALKISFPLSLIFMCFLFFGAGWISSMFHEPSLTPILQIFSIAVPFSILASVFIYATIGFQEMKYRVYTNDLFQNIFKLAVLITLLYFGFGVLGASFAWVVSIIGTSFLAAYYLNKKVFPLFTTRIKSISVDRELLSFSWPLMLITISGLIMGYMDTLMLGYFSMLYDVGVYNAVLPTAKLISVVFILFVSIFMPVISDLYSRGRSEEIRRTYSIVTKWILSFSFPLFLLMFLFAKPIINILFGGGYASGATALIILAFGYLISSVLGLSGTTLVAFGRTRIPMVASFVGVCANVTLNLYLIPIYGINGAAVATSASNIIMHIFQLIFVYHISKLHPFRWTHLKPLFSSSLAVLLVYGVTKALFEPVTAYVLIPMFFVFLALYFFLLLLLKGFEEEDLMIMKAIEERVGIKSELPRKIIKMFLR